MKVINIRILFIAISIVIISLLGQGCKGVYNIRNDSFFNKYSKKDIHFLVILDYLQRTKSDCIDCKLRIKGILHYKASHCLDLIDEYEDYYDKNDSLDLRSNRIVIEDFGSIYFCGKQLCENSYQFSQLIFDKKFNNIVGQVYHPDGSIYLFTYKIIGNELYLSIINNITHDCY